MSDIEPIDDELRAALRRRAAGGATSTAAAHEAVLRRAGTIRRRRAAIGGAGAMTVLAVGGIMLLPGSADELGPAVTGDVLPSFDEPTTTLVAGPGDPIEGAAPVTVDRSIPGTTTRTSSTLPDTSSSVPASPAGSSDAAPTSSVPIAAEPTSSTASTRSVPTSSVPSTSAPTSSAPATSAPATALAPFTDTYESIGGSLTVSWNGTALVLQAVAPALGFVAEVEDSSTTRIRVRFEGGSGVSRIEVRISDGEVVVDID